MNSKDTEHNKSQTKMGGKEEAKGQRPMAASSFGEATDKQDNVRCHTMHINIDIDISPRLLNLSVSTTIS